MSGELVPSMFRYVTTNNRDFVIGDPTDSVGLLQSKYIVFQTNTTPGYSTNPYIGVVYNGSSWTLNFSSNGSTVSSLALLNAPNTFTTASSNIFEGTTSFTGIATFTNASANIFNSPVTFNYPVTYNSTITYSGAVTFPAGITVTSSSTFNSSVSIVGGLTVGSSVILKGNTLVLNNTSTTAASVGSGILIEGTGNTTIASIQLTTTSTVSDTWAISTNSTYPFNIMCDVSYPATLQSSGLTASRVYNYPNATGTLLIREAGFAGGKLLIASSDLLGVAESAISIATITAISTGTYAYGISATSGTFSGTVSASSFSTSGILSATNGAVFGSAISVSGSITGTSFIGSGANLTGTATGLISGGVFVSYNSTSAFAYQLLFGSNTLIAGCANITASPSTGTITATNFIGSGAGLTGVIASGGVASSLPWSGLTGTVPNVSTFTNDAGYAVAATLPISGGHKGLVISTTGTSSVVSISATQLTLSNGAGSYVLLSSVAVSATATLTINTWSAVYVIYNGTLSTGFVSSSYPIPTGLPTGYTYYELVGMVYPDSINLYPLHMIQYGNDVQYVVSTTGNITVPLQLTIVSNVASYAACVPTNAAKVVVSVGISAGSNSWAGVAPNASYGTSEYGGSGGGIASMGWVGSGGQGVGGFYLATFLIENYPNISTSGSPNGLWVVGYSLNL